MRKSPGSVDRTAISPYDRYCDGYSRPGSTGNGYVSVLKVSVGEVEKTDDFLLDGIVAYDRAEANDAYIGQINMGTASSFCGIAGNIWGYDIARCEVFDSADGPPVLFMVKQYDGSDLPVYSADPLIGAGRTLFGTEEARRFPPAPGAHVICANKSTTNLRPAGRDPDPDKGEAYGVWCFIAITMADDRDNAADLFIEDAGTWTENDDAAALEAFLERHQRSVAWSVTACGADQQVRYHALFVGYAYLIMQPGHVGTALTVAPYVTLARDAVPGGNFDRLYDMSLPEWEREIT